jgi:hypothetical protein
MAAMTFYAGPAALRRNEAKKYGRRALPQNLVWTLPKSHNLARRVVWLMTPRRTFETIVLMVAAELRRPVETAAPRRNAAAAVSGGA